MSTYKQSDFFESLGPLEEFVDQQPETSEVSSVHLDEQQINHPDLFPKDQKGQQSFESVEPFSRRSKILS
jgi:hypothetical protein